MTHFATHKMRIALGACALIATAGLAAPHAAFAQQPPSDLPPDSGAAYYEVSLDGSQSAEQLEALGVDVLEVNGDTIEVLADSKIAAKLEKAGFDAQRGAPLHAKTRQSVNAAEGTYYGGYHTVAAHEAHNAAVAAAHPDLVKLHDIGDSYLKTVGKGGHDIQALCITDGAPNACQLDTTGKPKMLMMAQIHAREVTTGELAYRWIDELVTSSDPEILDLLSTRELWIVPIANPDGVDKVASNPTAPLPQRKNMNYESADAAECGLSMGSQAGVDLNRNSDFQWSASEGGPCAQTYPGVAPDSEPEVRAVEGLISAIYGDHRADDLESPAEAGATGTFLTLHSYSNLIIHPFSFDYSTVAPDNDAMQALGEKMSLSNGYGVGTAPQVIGYAAHGGTDDWAYGRLGVASFTFEVGSSGSAESCGGFFPVYRCMDGFWNENRGAFITAAKAAAAPYAG